MENIIARNALNDRCNGQINTVVYLKYTNVLNVTINYSNSRLLKQTESITHEPGCLIYLWCNCWKWKK